MSSLKKRKLALGTTPPFVRFSVRTDGRTHLLTFRVAGGVLGFRGYHPICIENQVYYLENIIYDVKFKDALLAVDCKSCRKKMAKEA